MVKDAEANAADDKKRREAVDAKKPCRRAGAFTEKGAGRARLEGRGQRAPRHRRRRQRFEGSAEGEDAEAIKTKSNTLAQASMKLGEAMYKQQAEADAAKDAAKDGRGRRGFTEVDDDKNTKKSA